MHICFVFLHYLFNLVLLFIFFILLIITVQSFIAVADIVENTERQNDEGQRDEKTETNHDDGGGDNTYRKTINTYKNNIEA